ncbi:ATP-grasp domain-containing protein (plasmid) [Streptosporangium sp. NBC_01495]|uniref:ATP-binding protein n=1 Tax=Streptosporangium sp. NBC_01495 TaxID=2903899 RepID=UPI002E311AE1|nr:ATP-grasp domain-containing protein [Streptosporangium sp. NBC_01495]
MLLIGGITAHSTSTESTLRALSASHPVVVADTAQATWQRPYLADELCPLTLTTKHVLRAITARGDAPAGVLTFDERLAPLAADVADHLDLPGYGHGATQVTGDRWRLYHRLHAVRCPTPRARLVATVDEAVIAAAGIGYPVILKPRFPSGGRGALLARSVLDVVLAYPSYTGEGGRAGGVIVQAYLPGPEISAVCLTQGGHSAIAAIARTVTHFTPAATVASQLVDAGDPARTDPALDQVVRAALAAAGIANGCSTVTVRLTRYGPMVIEVNLAAGDGVLAQLVRLASGTDLVAEAAATALGHPVGAADREYRSAAVTYIHAPGQGRIERLQTRDDLAGMPWVEQLCWQLREGDEVTFGDNAPPPRVGHAIVTGQDPVQCMRLAERINAGTRVILTAADQVA